jgi:hypothetical protein
MAEGIRREREPQITSVIGFTVPQTGQPRRTVVRRIVNMLGDDDVASIADFSVFLLSQHNQL